MVTAILNFIRVVGNETVACATYMFREDARIWWEVISQTRNVNTLDWEKFRTLFNEKYYNDAVRTSKAEEFSKLL